MDGILYQIIDVSEYINFLQQKYQKLFLLIKIFFCRLLCHLRKGLYSRRRKECTLFEVNRKNL